MSTMKRALWIGLLLLPACNAPTVSQGGVDESEVKTLSLPEPGAPAAEYSRRQVTLRLFGTQGFDQPGVASATVAETGTWVTRTVRLGGVLGRSWRLAEVRADGVQLRYGDKTLSLPVGGDVQSELIEHAFDRAVLDQGQHQYAVQRTELARLHQRYGLGASAEAVTYGDFGPALRLSEVAPGSALARMGLSGGDMIFTIDDVQAQPGDVALAVSRLESAASVVRVRMAHGHSIWEAAYVSR